jgi:hypothetical protein
MPYVKMAKSFVIDPIPNHIGKRQGDGYGLFVWLVLGQ